MPENHEEPRFRVCRQVLYTDGECATTVFVSNLTHGAAVELAYKGNRKHGGEEIETTCPIDGTPIRSVTAYYFEPEPEPLLVIGRN